MIKSNDIAMIILVVSITLMGSFFAGNAIISNQGIRSTEVQIATPFSADFSQPSDKIFNEFAINPTKEIRISSNKTDKPFVQDDSQN